jgi:hypothetical protein
VGHPHHSLLSTGRFKQRPQHKLHGMLLSSLRGHQLQLTTSPRAVLCVDTTDTSGHTPVTPRATKSTVGGRRTAASPSGAMASAIGPAPSAPTGRQRRIWPRSDLAPCLQPSLAPLSRCRRAPRWCGALPPAGSHVSPYLPGSHACHHRPAFQNVDCVWRYGRSAPSGARLIHVGST